MNLPRRTLFPGALGLGALALMGCQGGATIDPTQAIADANIVVKGISGVLALYPNAIKPADQIKVSVDLTAANAILAGLSASAAFLTTAQGLHGIETAINDVLAIVGAVPGLPPQVTAGVMAAQVLLPLIESVVNQLQNKPVVAARVAASAMSPGEARAVLRAVGK